MAEAAVEQTAPAVDGGITAFRYFPIGIEQLARDWRQRLLAEGGWVRHKELQHRAGEASGFFVTNGTTTGYCKPGKNTPPVLQHPRAAHEKIVSDLAFELGLPVPPAMLYEQPQIDPGQERYTVITAVPFKTVHPWSEIARTQYSAPFCTALRSVASAMVPFDTWVQNTDRHNGGNLVGEIVDEGQGGENLTIRGAYIDYANSLMYAWRRAAHDVIQAIGVYPGECAVDLRAMSEMVSRIERLRDSVIEEIVGRIPAEFLAGEDRNLIVVALLSRRMKLRTVLLQQYPEMP